MQFHNLLLYQNSYKTYNHNEITKNNMKIDTQTEGFVDLYEKHSQ
jgi:hypothetical protein